MADRDLTPPGAPGFLIGGGEMGALMRAHPWAESPLGDPEDWPHSLKSYVGLMLASTQPMFMASGPARTWLYNDAFIQILGQKHPNAFGQRSEDVWAEAWNALEPLFDQVFAGEPVHIEGFSIGLDRRGRIEEAVFDFSYTPVRGDDGVWQGLFGVCIETTARVLAERNKAAATERQRRQFEQAPGFICILSGPEHVFEFVNETHRRLFGSDTWVGKPVRVAFPDIAGQGFYELLDQVRRTGERVVVSGAPVRYRLAPNGPEENRYLDFVYAPITEEDGPVSGIFCEGFDVTDVHRAHELLRESEARLRQLNADLEQEVHDRSHVGGQTWQLSPEMLGVANGAGFFENTNPGPHLL